jgi:hypothetical protein
MRMVCNVVKFLYSFGDAIVFYYYYYYYYYYYLLQLGFHPVAVVFKLVHTTNGNIIYIKITIQNKLYTITKENTYSKYKYTH